MLNWIVKGLKSAGQVAGVQAISGQEKPSRPPRGSGEVHPVDTIGAGKPETQRGGANTAAPTQTPIDSATRPPAAGHQSTNANMVGRSTQTHSGGVSPVHTEANAQSVQQGSRAQVSSASSQGGVQAQSKAQTVQEGSRVQQNVQQNTQNLTNAANAPAPHPVPTQQHGNAPAGAASSASRQVSPPAPVKTAAQAGKVAPKSQAPKPVPKAAPSASAQPPKTTKPMDTRMNPEPPKQTGLSHTPGAAGKNQAPAPIDIGTDADKPPVSQPEQAFETPPEAVTEHE